MRLLVALLCLALLSPRMLSAETNAAVRSKQAATPVKRVSEQDARPTEKGLFVIEPAIPGSALRVGSNVIELTVRNKFGKGVEGAKIIITPWSADMGSGVWEKPLLSEKGGGVYRAENISIIRNGRWELKVSVKSGSQEDRAVFAYTVSQKEQTAAPRTAKAKGDYSRSVQRYTLPNVTLLNQDGKRVNLKSLTESGKPVIVNFIYTTCTTICPVLSASFTNLRKGLGPDVETVQFISISIDPEHDRPEQMKKYLSRFTTQKGWDFLTGSREDINKVLKVFDAFVSDKMAHEPLYLMRGPHSDEWVRIKGLTWSADLLSELRSVEKR